VRLLVPPHPGCAVRCGVLTLCPGEAMSCTRSCLAPWTGFPCSGVLARRDSTRHDVAIHVCTPKRGNTQRITTTYTTMNTTSHNPSGTAHLHELGQSLTSSSALSAAASRVVKKPQRLRVAYERRLTATWPDWQRAPWRHPPITAGHALQRAG